MVNNNYLSVANLTCPVVKVKKTLSAGQPIKQLRELKTASGREAYAPERAIAFAHPIPVSQLWDHRTFWQNPPSAASPAFQSLQKRSSPSGANQASLLQPPNVLGDGMLSRFRTQPHLKRANLAARRDVRQLLIAAASSVSGSRSLRSPSNQL